MKILGPSCANCLKLEMLVMQVLEQLGIQMATVQKVASDREIEDYLTGDPPGLVIDKQLVWSGGKELPTRGQVQEWISSFVRVPA
ncbi:MAG: thioredoxin family protein [Rudaea sp.]